MATKKDIQIITILRYEIGKAKREKKDIGIYLSGGEPFYSKAINSQRNAGFATLICGVVGMVFLVTRSIAGLIVLGDTGSIVSFAVIGGILAGIGVFMGVKTNSLKITPTAMLVLTICQLVYSIFMLIGIASVIAIVFNIIALARWSTYKNWFYDIDVEYYKEKAREHKTKK